MDDYKKLIEMLRSRSKAIIHEDAKLVDIPEENIWDADANALAVAADAIEQLIKERDAAVKEIARYACCGSCKYHDTDKKEEPCLGCNWNWKHDSWEWRGVQDE